MKKYILAAIIFIIASFIIMMFFNKPLLSLTIWCFGLVFIFLAALEEETHIEYVSKNSNILMCPEGIIRHVKIDR